NKNKKEQENKNNNNDNVTIHYINIDSNNDKVLVKTNIDEDIEELSNKVKHLQYLLSIFLVSLLIHYISIFLSTRNQLKNIIIYFYSLMNDIFLIDILNINIKNNFYHLHKIILFFIIIKVFILFNSIGYLFVDQFVTKKGSLNKYFYFFSQSKLNLKNFKIVKNILNKQTKFSGSFEFPHFFENFEQKIKNLFFNFNRENKNLLKNRNIKLYKYDLLNKNK